MPRNITVTFDDGSSHVYENAPDDITPGKVTERAQQEFSKTVSSLDGGRSEKNIPMKAQDVPVDFNGQTDVPLTPDMAGYQQQQQYMQQPAQAEPSLFDKNMAVLKGVGVLAGNAIPGTIGALGGAIYGFGRDITSRDWKNNPSQSIIDGSDYVTENAQAFSPFSTSDPLANQYIDKIGGALGALDPGYAALAGIREYPNVKPSSQIAATNLEGTFNNLSGRTANRNIADRILAGDTSKDLAPFMVKQPESKNLAPIEYTGKNTPTKTQPEITPPKTTTKAVNDAAAKEAIRQGYDQGFVQSIKQKNPETQRSILKMADISEKGKNDMDYRYNNRPSDVVGDALMKPIRHLQKVNSEAGKSLDDVAAKLKGQAIDYEKPLGEFKNSIENLGVSIGEDGNLNFDRSSIRFSNGDKKLIKNIYSAANDTNGIDAFKAHELKKLIDTTVDYGSNPSGTGITKAGERAVKKFRAAIDSELDSKFADYKEVNTRYSDSIDALNDIQDASGPRIDLTGKNANSALGTRLSALLSKQQGRIALKDAIEKVDNISKKYGGDFKEDIPALVGAANELDRVHGSHAETSFLGETEKGTATGIKNASRDLSNMTILGAVATGGAKAIDYVRRITPESQYKSLKDLLARDAKKESEKPNTIDELSKGK